MEIRKEFKYEMGHIVRNAWSRRCSKNAHGHSYRVEFLFKGSGGDNGQMLVDFGFLKKYLHPFVDAFDHSFWLWDRPEDAHIIKFFRENFERVIVSPYSTTAEMQAQLFATYGYNLINYLREHNMFENGESLGDLRLSAVRVHETTTGYAEFHTDDIGKFPITKLCDLEFSQRIQNEWPAEFHTFYNNFVPHKSVQPEIYVEITARQTGKTTRLIKSAINWANTNGDAVIFSANHEMGECLVEQIGKPLALGDGRIYVVPFDNRERFLLGRTLNNPRYFYDEFDFFNWSENEDIMDNAYLTTTPKFIRFNGFEKNDPIFKALSKSRGIFWGQTRNHPDYPANENGTLVHINGQRIPDYLMPLLGKELACYHINVDQNNNR